MTYKASRRNAPDTYNRSTEFASTEAARRGIGEKAAREDEGLRRIVPVGIRPKSKLLLPHRFAIGCEDGLADP